MQYQKCYKIPPRLKQIDISKLKHRFKRIGVFLYGNKTSDINHVDLNWALFSLDSASNRGYLGNACITRESGRRFSPIKIRSGKGLKKKCFLSSIAPEDMWVTNSMLYSKMTRLAENRAGLSRYVRIGASYLGQQILYHLINKRPDCMAERVFQVWPDMEQKLKERGLPLFSLETATPLAISMLSDFPLPMRCMARAC
jgi:hypothetical protein